MDRSNRRLLLVLLATVVGTFGVAPAVAAAGTYYVSPSGRDANSGRSPSRPWQTVYRVDKAGLRPGDTVLFQGGATFADQPLMPGWGLSVSGRSHRPVTFGSYGNGRANLPKGIWMKGERHLVFENFNLGPFQSIGGTGSFSTVEHCTMTNLTSTDPNATELGINLVGSHWLIMDNYIANTGDSGMLLRGSHFTVVGNAIFNTGIDQRLTYGEHGIYLKSTNSKVIGNTIIGFRDNGVSVRYTNALVENNTIAGGKFGIAYFQWSSHYGTARFIGNRISRTTIAAIYVSPADIGGQTDANIVIRRNVISRTGGGSKGAQASIASGWEPIALSKNRGHYRVHGNKVV
jgi:hypothetical protein